MMTDHILVVDDDRIVAETLCLIFQKQGFTASAAYSADEGMQMARKLHPQLVLCDVTMPERSGLELVEDLSREMPECRVIVLTGYLSNLVKANEQARKSPEKISVMSKPCAPEQLLRAAGAMLRRA
jgi:DNA-binding NtrC family response regulator